MEQLLAYDEGRTRHIEYLKNELMRMHNLHPAPVIIEKEHGGQNDVAMDSLDSNKEH